LCDVFVGETCCGDDCCPEGQLCCAGTCYDPSTQKCCLDPNITVCDINEICCNGTCCDPNECCIDGICVEPICDNCHPINDTAFECGHYEWSTTCASNWCIIDVLDTATCDFHPDSQCPSKCAVEVAPGEPPPPAVWQYQVILNSPICMTGGEPVEYHDWNTIYFGCETCSTETYKTACETFGCPGNIVDSARRGTKMICAGTCQ
jgi:hypothetical protein